MNSKELSKEVVIKTVSTGLIFSSVYTGAYLAVKRPSCQHASFDPIMGTVRGITGAVIGGYLGCKAVDYFKSKMSKEDKNE